MSSVRKKIVVVVSQRVEYARSRGETRDALDQSLIKWLSWADLIPVPVPNILSLERKLGLWLKAIKPQAIVLSGGNDIGENQPRDITEYALLAYAQEKRIPLLGICRGMQIMGQWAGASLESVVDHVGTYHELSGEIEKKVNSFHNYSLSACPENFHVFARSLDGAIEAIRHDTLPWEAWMWHPEREPEFDELDRLRLITLFHASQP